MKMRSTTAMSLLECLFVLSLVSILMLIAAPNYSVLMQRSQIDSTAHTLSDILQQARTLALRQQTSVHLCGSANPHHCDNDWQAGVRITWGADSNAPQWLYHTWPSQLCAVQFRGALGAQSVHFLPTGHVVANGRFIINMIANATPQLQSQIIVSHSGRSRHSAA